MPSFCDRHPSEPSTGFCMRCGDKICAVCTMQGKREHCYDCIVTREDELRKERARFKFTDLLAWIFIIGAAVGTIHLTSSQDWPRPFIVVATLVAVALVQYAMSLVSALIRRLTGKQGP